MCPPNLATHARRSLLAISFVSLICVPAFAQPDYQGPGSVPPGESEAPDPGFAHNHGGRNIGDISTPDYGAYCGPLPRHVCFGTSFYYVLRSDPFAPKAWLNHRGNTFATAKSLKKGWPLQTVTVLRPDGTPAVNARVRFFEAGYRSTGVVGKTDEQGRFQVAVKRVKRNQRFVVEAKGYQSARLDVLGKEIHAADHQLILAEAGPGPRVENVHQVAVMADVSVPKELVRDYKKAQKAIEREKWNVAVAELTALIERWPIGTLADGALYQPQALLVEALAGAGEAQLAEEVDQRSFQIVKAEAAG